MTNQTETAAAVAASNSEADKSPKTNRKKLIIGLSAAAVLIIAAGVVITAIALSNRRGNDAYDPYADGEYIDVFAPNRYSGVVEPQDTVKVDKDTELKVDQIYVKVGDTVKKGDKLFSYDSAQAKLDLELAKLEYDGYGNEITGYDNQIAELTRQRDAADSDQKLDYTLQIQQAELSKSRTQMSQKAKQVEIERLEKKIDTSAVLSPIDGVIKSISNGSGDDAEGTDSAFITILTADGYRVKGSVDELNLWSLNEGMAVKVYSRADESVSWDGTISKIDTQSTDSDSSGYQDYYYYGGSQESASKYTFYVELDATENILLGQHVYIEPVYEYDDGDYAEDDFIDDGAVSDDVAPDQEE